jgi:Glycosyltransferase (GlcNAc)
MPSLFISIAAYCDPLLRFTVERAVAMARHPDQLRFGIVDQSPRSTRFDLAASAPAAQLTVIHVDPAQARGPCWARAVAMGLYRQEDWFLQIDSHMDFDSGWDEQLIASAHQCAATSGKNGTHRLSDMHLVLSSYPNPFHFKGIEPVPVRVGEQVLAHVVKPGATLADTHPVLPFEAHPLPATQPVPGFHLGAGCLFGPGTLVEALPYDPFYYFHGEEQAYALRLFTHGWDIYHPVALPLFHLYNDGSTPARPLHWDEAVNAQRSENWWAFEQRSRERLRRLIARDPHLGIYGLGTARTLADYARFSGIDYEQRTLSPSAFVASAQRGYAA